MSAARWWAPLLLLLAAGPARGQMLHLDPLPFHAPADSTSRLALVVGVERGHDPRPDWHVNRILLTALLPAGERAVAFLRISHASFDTGEIPVTSRWPWVAGPDAGDGWPGEERVSGFGKLEAGITGPVRLPVLGAVDYGLALGLPTGSDRLYPVSSQSLPLRSELRKPLRLGAGLRLGLELGHLLHMDSGREFLDPIAFPGGYRYGASLAAPAGAGVRAELGYSVRVEDGHESALASVQLWFPWGAAGGVGLRAERELAGTLDRFAAWRVGVSWRLDSLRHRPGRDGAAAD